MFDRVAERFRERRLRILSRQRLAAPFEESCRDPRRFQPGGAAFAVQVLRRAAGTVRAELTLFTSCGRLFGEKIFFAPNASECLTEFRPRNDKPLLLYTK